MESPDKLELELNPTYFTTITNDGELVLCGLNVNSPGTGSTSIARSFHGVFTKDLGFYSNTIIQLYKTVYVIIDGIEYEVELKNFGDQCVYYLAIL